MITTLEGLTFKPSFICELFHMQLPCELRILCSRFIYIMTRPPNTVF